MFIVIVVCFVVLVLVLIVMLWVFLVRVLVLSGVCIFGWNIIICELGLEFGFIWIVVKWILLLLVNVYGDENNVDINVVEILILKFLVIVSIFYIFLVFCE